MVNPKHSDNELATASAPLMIYCALAGVCAFLMFILSIVMWPPDRIELIVLASTALISVILGVLAWGIRNERKWAWIPGAGLAAVFATAFPIGTIISYFALTSLWKCRESFFPFSRNPAEPSAAGKPPGSPLSSEDSP